MKTSSKFAGLAIVCLGTLALARTSSPRLTVAAPSGEEARALLAAVAPQGSGNVTPVPLEGGQAAAFVRHVWTEIDHLSGVEIEIHETPRHWVVRCRQLSPEGPAIGYARVRHETPFASVDHVLTRVGESWITQVPKALGLLPGTSVSAGCWSESGDPAAPSAALYFQTIEI